MEANEAMKAMARRIVNANSNYMDGLNRGQCNFSAQEVLAIALAAIMETQAQHVEWLRTEATSPKALRVKGAAAITALADAANALERGEHYALAGER